MGSEYLFGNSTLTEENGKKYENLVKNGLEEYKKDFKHKIESIDQVLRKFKKVFKIVPVTLKNSTKKEIVEYREFVLYLLVIFTKIDISKISVAFNTTKEKLIQIKKDKCLEKKHKEKENKFFEFFLDDYLLSCKRNISFGQELLHNMERFQEIDILESEKRIFSLDIENKKIYLNANGTQISDKMFEKNSCSSFIENGVVEYNGKIGLLHKSGCFSIDPIFEKISYINDKNIILTIDGKSYVGSTECYLVLATTKFYDELTYIKENQYLAKIGQYYGIVEKDGTIVVEFKHKSSSF